MPFFIHVIHWIRRTKIRQIRYRSLFLSKAATKSDRNYAAFSQTSAGIASPEITRSNPRPARAPSYAASFDPVGTGIGAYCIRSGVPGTDSGLIAGAFSFARSAAFSCFFASFFCFLASSRFRFWNE